jgi:hypothetical protein
VEKTTAFAADDCLRPPGLCYSKLTQHILIVISANKAKYLKSKILSRYEANYFASNMSIAILANLYRQLQFRNQPQSSSVAWKLFIPNYMMAMDIFSGIEAVIWL